MTFALFYRGEGYSLRSSKLMGRQAAGDSFIKGFFQHSRGAEFPAVAPNKSEYAEFQSKLESINPQGKATYVYENDLAALSKIKGIFYPGPDISRLAYQRSFHNSLSNGWCLTGITHTTSSATAMDAITDLLSSPVQPWDSVICTSTAVKKNVEVLMQAQVDYLKDRLGITKITLPLFPVVPLGINTREFSFSSKEKADARTFFGISEDTIVFLYVGRLAFHGKAHPFAMYVALQEAAKITGKQIVLLECGWHANEYIRDAFEEGSKFACPNVTVKTLDGRNKDIRNKCWASADVFCSLSDNIQETYGISPVEAMASGLPVVVSDWDGYKDTVRHGKDGFRISTMSPAPGTCNDLAYRHAFNLDSYDMYIGHYSSLVSVKQEELVTAIASLCNSKKLRREMGASGALRARQFFDWERIIPIYEDLWEEQTSIKNSIQRQTKNKRVGAPTNPWPARIDPSIGFQNYASCRLEDHTKLTMVIRDIDLACQRYEQYTNLKMINYTEYTLPTAIEVKRVFDEAERNDFTEIELSAFLPLFTNKRRGHSVIAFLSKLGFFRF
jgi:starch synthase